MSGCATFSLLNIQHVSSAALILKQLKKMWFDDVVKRRGIMAAVLFIGKQPPLPMKVLSLTVL